MFNKIVGSIGAFSYRNRKVISIVALILFIAVFIVSSQLVIEYSYAEESIVNDIFPQDDNLVIVYDNKDEDKIADIIKQLEKDEHISSIQAYANTLGAQMSPSDMSEMMGIPVAFVNTLYYIHGNGMDTTGMTLVEFVNFISSDDFLNNELFSSMIDDESKAQILQLKSIIDALSSEQEYTAEEISDILGVEKELVQSIFLIAQLKESSIISITPMFWSNIANFLGMDAETIEKIFGIQPIQAMTFTEFVDVITEVSGNLGAIMDEEQTEQLDMFKQMSDMVKEEKELSPEDLAGFFGGAAENDMFNENTVALLYVMAKSNTVDMSEVRIPLYDLFIFLSEDILKNEAFSSFFDESVAAQFEEAKATMEDGLAQLVGESHSRMVLTLNYAVESEEIYAFYDDLHEMLDSTLSGEYYLVGMTAMSDEVSKSFETEYLIISIVTAIAVFSVVLFTFKKLLLSLLLIGVIECAVFSMMTVMVIIDLPMYFIPLILVQCILMGSMIDYGILFTTYYKEVRKEFSVEEALPEVMRRATHSILTSSILIVAVTLICGRLMSGAVASILTTLGIGSLCAILLILFVLPSLLVIFDKQVIKQKRKTDIDEFDQYDEPAKVEVTTEAKESVEAEESADEAELDEAEDVAVEEVIQLEETEETAETVAIVDGEVLDAVEEADELEVETVDTVAEPDELEVETVDTVTEADEFEVETVDTVTESDELEANVEAEELDKSEEA